MRADNCAVISTGKQQEPKRTKETFFYVFVCPLFFVFKINKLMRFERGMRKEQIRSFEDEVKEPVIKRVFQLVEHRYSSRSEAAKAWGINVNTLNNYYKRVELNPVPRKEQLQKIAACEGVSLEWLLTGGGEGIKKEKRTNMSEKVDRLTEVLSFLTESERNSLAEVLARKGVETALYLLDEDNIKLLQLDRVVKAKILGLQSNAAASLNDERAKECGSDSAIGAASTSLTGGHKQAV